MLTRLLLCLAVALAAACAPLPPGGKAGTPAAPQRPEPPGGFPRSAEQVSGPAVVALLNQARQDRDAGRPLQADAALERALRIEPRNAFVWHALAATRLDENLPEQAESVAFKSNSLAQGNPYIEIENWRLIAAARRARDDRAGAEEAQGKVAELQALLER